MDKNQFKNYYESLANDSYVVKMLEEKDATEVVLEMMRRVGEIADSTVALGSSKRSQEYKESAARDMGMNAAYVITACKRLIDIASDVNVSETSKLSELEKELNGLEQISVSQEKSEKKIKL